MGGALPEESKVKLGEPACSSGGFNKRGATRVARWLHSFFKEQACPQSGEASLLRWFWRFTGHESGVAACSGCLRDGGHRFAKRQIESSSGALNRLCPPRQLFCFQFPHHLLDRLVCRQTPLHRVRCQSCGGAVKFGWLLQDS
jgi:hypothetical protein